LSEEIDFEKCVATKKIKDSEIAKEWVNKEIAVAQKFIRTTQFSLNSKQYDLVIISGYLVIFHLNRALVYNKGKIVKTHICAMLAVKELYKNNADISDLLEGLDNALTSRNQIQYDGFDADVEMAEFVFNLAQDYLEIVKKLVGE
jgi:uncharacterized protein (UPF0332 family)